MEKTNRILLVVLVTLGALGFGACRTARQSPAKSGLDNCCSGCKAWNSSAKKVSYR
jgi:hypothetical protein